MSRCVGGQSRPTLVNVKQGVPDRHEITHLGHQFNDTIGAPGQVHDARNVKSQDHYWKFGLPAELKSTVELAVKGYNSNDVPLSAQAIFGPVTANINQYKNNDFQLGLNNEYGVKLYPVYTINP